MSEQTEQPYAPEPSTRSEMIKFGILAVILLGVPLVIMLLNPIIFGQIVPAVMGEGIVIEEAEPAPSDTDATDSATDEETSTEGEADSMDEEATEMEEGAEENTEEGAENVNEEGEGETAVDDQSEPITHTVKQGETLNSIARDYGVTVQAIMQANNIVNPNRINLGTDLIIPPTE